ncbi:sensor histidine kinase [Paenibacillus allorhizosphaerae]|uniref:Heme sensor protein HssS n=1 Tax=Paenibacillus allorhizosphaerae TaxID=2849866 RepID=A0ABM8VSY9_9BACL|nr:HAMP domain-containing sensor histidine kinase [Paenibacillus allorhizosphaerae]CAG7657048.1 Heme sensor protein HssS [Paenibacillus allorhizosphaerae]
MKTLYFRIVLTFILIAMISGLLALALSNLYLGKITGNNEQKVLRIGNEIRALYERTPNLALGDYLTHIAGMGFQIYAVNGRMEGASYGAPFKHWQMDEQQIRRVLQGETYYGMEKKRFSLTGAGFFENSIRNSIGIPMKVEGNDYALFVRPNLEQQIGDVHILLALLLGLTFCISIVLIAVMSRYIVKPVKKLTEATDKIIRGDYEIAMDVSRQDELGNLARHFTQMAHSLQQLDEMRQEFVANVSHEIQSPLTSIQGFAQAILEREASPEEAQRYLRIIEEESRRLSSLSKQLLTLAALDKETAVIKTASFRLDEQIRQVLIVTEYQWAEKQLTVLPDLPDVVITADPQLLHHVWLNLITNSIKFSQRGGTIRIRIVTGRDVAVEIRDTGKGIPESELPHIFDRFYKADKARNRTRSGTGLGLSIVKKIVELHRGSIDVQSELGQGTTVTVRFPSL